MKTTPACTAPATVVVKKVARNRTAWSQSFRRWVVSPVMSGRADVDRVADVRAGAPVGAAVAAGDLQKPPAVDERGVVVRGRAGVALRQAANGEVGERDGEPLARQGLQVALAHVGDQVAEVVDVNNLAPDLAFRLDHFRPLEAGVVFERGAQAGRPDAQRQLGGGRGASGPVGKRWPSGAF